MAEQEIILQEINERIIMLDDCKDISDGHHTFNELYEHRYALFIALLNSYKSKKSCWKSKQHSDNTPMYKDSFVCGIDNIITYHLPMEYWDLLQIKEIDKGLYDGHTSKQVIGRLIHCIR